MSVSFRRWVHAAVALILLSSGIQVAAAAASRAGKTHTVTIEGTSFKPDALTIAVGDSVVWVNRDPFPHTATANGGAFDSKNIEPEKSWKFTARKKGEYAYVCALHPTMKGLVTVE